MAKFCSECGTRAEGGKFCAECGTRYNDAEASASQPPMATLAPNQVEQAHQYLSNANNGNALPAGSVRAMANSFNSSNGGHPNALFNSNGTQPQNYAEAYRNYAPQAATAYNAYAANANSSNGNSYSSQNSWQPPRPPQADNSFSVKAQPDYAPQAAPAHNTNSSNGNNNSNSFSSQNSWQPPRPPQANNSFNGKAQPDLAPPPPAQAGPNASAWPSKEQPDLAPTPPVAKVTVPSAATGEEAQEVYEDCVSTIRAARGGHNDQGVKAFKQNCRAFGLQQMAVQDFYNSLVVELGPEHTQEFVPNLAKLIPDDNKRKELVEYAAQQGSSFHGVRMQSFQSQSSTDDRGSFVGPGPDPHHQQTAGGKGMMTGRYADHPNCDICFVRFDVTKRRHQCRVCGQAVCSNCSPVWFMVPENMKYEHAKTYDPSLPQRVCISCAPKVEPYQDQLVAQFARSRNDNAHQASGRIHMPYSSDLMKECNNAADIIGNFFRDDWGSAADRAIPVKFLEKAHGIAVLTIFKAGFLVTGKIGTGLVIGKLANGQWSAPSAIGTVGLGGGFEIGGELVEVMIILGSEGALKVFHKPQINIGAGLDLTVGPFGRSAEAAASASASGLNANYSYSQSKGFYAGISLQGAVITARNDLNRKFYGRDLQPSEILGGYVEQPNAAKPLYQAIANAMRGIEMHKQESLRRASIMGPCRACNCPMFVAHTTQVWNKKCKTCDHHH